MVPAVNYDTAEYRRSASATGTNAIAAWEAGATGKGVTIGIIDSGISDPLGEFAGRISSASRDVTGQGRSVADLAGHGTAVSAIAAAARNDQGIVGIAHDATLAVMRADRDDCADGCRFSDNAIAAGVDAAVAAGAQVINLSLGGSSANATLRQAFARAANAGRVIVVAAGNDGAADADPLALAALAAAGRDHVIVAGALGASGEIAGFSNRAGGAESNYLLAPGENIRSFDQTGSYYLYSGTSMAAPAISAAVALLAQAFPGLSAASMVDILLRSADDAGAAGTDSVNGRGLLNIGKAMAPSGSTTLAGTAIPVSMAASGSLGSAFGDGLSSAAGLARVPVTDAYGRAYTLNLARNLRHASAARLAGRLQAASLQAASLDAAQGPFTLMLQIRASVNGPWAERPTTDAFRAHDRALAPLGFAQRGVDLRAGERNPLRETRLRLAAKDRFALVVASGRLADTSLPGSGHSGFLAEDALSTDDGSGTSGQQLLMAEHRRGPLTLAVAASRRQLRLRERNGVGHHSQQNRLTFAASLVEGPWRLSLHASDRKDKGALLGTRLSPGFGLLGGHGQTIGLAADFERHGYTLRLAGSRGRIAPDLSSHGLLRADGALQTASWSLAGAMPMGAGRLALHLGGPAAVTGGRFRLANGPAVAAQATARETVAELGYQLGGFAAFLYQRRDAGNLRGLVDRGGGFTVQRDF